MSTPIDPSDRLATLAAELGALGRRLDGMGSELLALRGAAAPGAPAGPELPGDTAGAAPAPGPRAPGPPSGPWPTAPVPGQAWPASPSGVRGPLAPPPAPVWPRAAAAAPPTPWAAAPPGPADPPAPSRPRVPAVSGAQLLAWTGGAVTLLGVVLLLALAASRGWFSPTARVVTGAVLGVALVGLGMRLHRRESARSGALALAATGVATLYLVVAAATSVVELVSTPVAVGLALLVAAGGVVLADRWCSELLGAGAAAGASVLAVGLVFEPLLVALVLVLQVAAAPVVWRRRWTWLAAVTAAGPVLYGALLAGLVGLREDRASTLAAVLGVLVVGLGVAVAARGRLDPLRVAALAVTSPVPVLVAAPALSGWGGAALAAGAAVALLGLAVLRGTERPLRIAALAAGAVALFEATAVALEGSTQTAVFLGQAVVLAVLAAALRHRLPLMLSAAYGTAGTLAALLEDAPLAALVDFPLYPYLDGGQVRTGALLAGAAVSALVLAFAAALVVAGGRTGLVRPDARSARLWVPAGAVGLYGAAGLVITLALLVAPDRAGFLAGHAIVTVSWTVTALLLLARGVNRPALRVTGLVLVASAVAKLVLFDLVALDGIARVAAFLGAGLVLLAAGTRYAGMVAKAEGGRDEAITSTPAAPAPR
jgi:uncharacterized membrane protein